MTKEQRKLIKQVSYKAKFQAKYTKLLNKEIKKGDAEIIFLMVTKKDIKKYEGYDEGIILQLAKDKGYNLNSRVESNYCYLYELTTRKVNRVKYIDMDSGES